MKKTIELNYEILGDKASEIISFLKGENGILEMLEGQARKVAEEIIMILESEEGITEISCQNISDALDTLNRRKQIELIKLIRNIDIERERDSELAQEIKRIGGIDNPSPGDIERFLDFCLDRENVALGDIKEVIQKTPIVSNRILEKFLILAERDRLALIDDVVCLLESVNPNGITTTSLNIILKIAPKDFFGVNNNKRFLAKITKEAFLRNKDRLKKVIGNRTIYTGNNNSRHQNFINFCK